MGCNCKNSGYTPEFVVSEKKGNIKKYIVKIFGFLLGLVLLPLIMLAIIWFMFDTIVLNKEVDLTKLINTFVKTDEKTNKVEEEYNEDELEILNVEDITNKRKK